jgi:ubiquinone biosynthesis protein
MMQTYEKLQRATRSLKSAKRLAQILQEFAKHGFGTLIERLGLTRYLGGKPVTAGALGESLETAQLQRVGQRLTRALQNLGPAFVKLGQILATRKDILPEEITAELSSLHSEVDTLPWSVIEKELDETLPDWKNLFVKFDQEPLAAGSIGQVHRATLQDGSDVVLKIRRPGVHKLVKQDLELMKLIAELMEQYLPDLQYMRPLRTIQEFSRGLLVELDFSKEAAHTEKFRKNFDGNENIHFPKVHWDHSSESILVLEFLNGSVLSQNPSLEQPLRKSIVKNGCEMFLQMAYVDGFVHGDLHPGNMMVLPDGKIGVLDSGVAVLFPQSARESLAWLMVSLVQEDFQSAALAYAELVDPGPSFDISAFEHDAANLISPLVGLDLGNVQTGKLMWELAKLGAKHQAPFPGDLILFLKTIATFDAIGRKLDPDFDLLTASQSYAQTIRQQLYGTDELKKQGLVIARDLGKLARYAPLQVRQILHAAVRGQLKVQTELVGAEGFSKHVSKAGYAIALGLCMLGVILATVQLTIMVENQPSYQGIPVSLWIGGFTSLALFWHLRSQSR